MTGPELVAAAAKAMLAAGSLKGTGTGALFSGTPSKFTLVLSGAESDVRLSVAGQPMTLITTKTASYIKAPLGFWTGVKTPPAIAKKLANRWIKVPATALGAGGFTLETITKELAHPTSGKILDGVTKGSYQGKPVYVVKQDDGSLIDIAAEGEPLPLYLENHGKDKSTFTFYDYGKPNVIVAPQGAQDIATLAK